MLNLARRKAFLGIRSATKSKHVDGTEVKILQIELEQIDLSAQEFNNLLNDAHAYDVLFHTQNGKVEPYLKALKRLQLAESVDGAYVELIYGLQGRSCELKDVKLSSIGFERTDDGKIQMFCKVSGPAVLDKHFGDLMEKLGDSIEVELRFEQPGQQPELPLNTHGAKGAPDVKREKVDVGQRRRSRTPAGDPLN